MSTARAALLSLLLATPAFAQDRAADIDRIFASLAPDAPGCTVGVRQNGKPVVSRAYGLAVLEQATPVVADTVFDMGSLQKQFVAASVLKLVEDGRLSLTEDIHRYLPELPDYGHKLTLDHLLTHTSGLRDWTALLPLASDKPEALTAILRQRGLNFAPGDEWAYSNSNFVLLKEIVARTSKTSFAEFARTRLFQPLGMTSTLYSVDMRDIVKNRAMAYEKEAGAWKVSMRLDNERGGGGILSTTGDLLLWNEALSQGRLGKFVTSKLEETAKLNNGRKLQYAHGLIVDTYRGTKQVWHSGGAAGYNAWLGRYPEHGLSIALMCNSNVAGGMLAHQVIDLFLPANAPGAGIEPPAPDPGLAPKAGLYVSDSGDLLRLGVERGILRIAAGPPLMPSGPDSFHPPRPDLFYRSQDAFHLTFASPDEVEIKSMEGAVTRYRRAQPWTPTADELQALAGRYESAELKTVFEIAPSRDGLAVRLKHNPGQTLPFKLAFRDTFQIGNVTLRFQRDAAGKVTGIDYANPVLRGVRFTRID